MENQQLLQEQPVYLTHEERSHLEYKGLIEYHMKLCNKTVTLTRCSNKECFGHDIRKLTTKELKHFIHPYNCGVKYCNVCRENRRIRAIKRLKGYKISKTLSKYDRHFPIKRVYHFSIGFNFDLSLYKSNPRKCITTLRKFTQAFLQKARKSNKYRLTGFSCLDHAYDIEHISNNSIFVHEHFATLLNFENINSLLRESAKDFNGYMKEVFTNFENKQTKKFDIYIDSILSHNKDRIKNKDFENKSKEDYWAVNVIGLRKWSNILDYFAKRSQAIYGHEQEGYYGLNKFLTLDEFATIGKLRTLNKIGCAKHLVNTNRDSDKSKCPYCDAPLEAMTSCDNTPAAISQAINDFYDSAPPNNKGVIDIYSDYVSDADTFSESNIAKIKERNKARGIEAYTKKGIAFMKVVA